MSEHLHLVNSWKITWIIQYLSAVVAEQKNLGTHPAHPWVVACNFHPGCGFPIYSYNLIAGITGSDDEHRLLDFRCCRCRFLQTLKQYRCKKLIVKQCGQPNLYDGTIGLDSLQATPPLSQKGVARRIHF